MSRREYAWKGERLAELLRRGRRGDSWGAIALSLGLPGRRSAAEAWGRYASAEDIEAREIAAERIGRRFGWQHYPDEGRMRTPESEPFAGPVFAAHNVRTRDFGRVPGAVDARRSLTPSSSA